MLVSNSVFLRNNQFNRYLHENLIRKIENLENLGELVSLNLTDNMIEEISGLGF